jgi:hypothetical protein
MTQTSSIPAAPLPAGGRAGLRWPCLLLVVGLLVLTACHTRHPAAVEPPTFDWQGKTPEMVIERFRQEQEKIETFTAAFSAHTTTPAQGQPANLQGVLFFKRSEDGPMLRIRVLAPFGRTAFDMVNRQGVLQIYIPSRRTLYLGASGDARANHPFQRLFAVLFIDFAVIEAAANNPIAIGELLVTLPLPDGYIRFRRASGLPFERKSGERTVHYDEYIHFEGLPSVPTLITVYEEGAEKGESICRLSDIELNTPLEEVFDLTGYQPDFIRQIQDLGGE